MAELRQFTAAEVPELLRPKPPPTTTRNTAGSRRSPASRFVYFRIYGPDEPAFDGSWQLPDFEAIT